MYNESRCEFTVKVLYFLSSVYLNLGSGRKHVQTLGEQKVKLKLLEKIDEQYFGWKTP
jgi:hypothetical protein